MKTINLLLVLTMLVSVNTGFALTNPKNENPESKTIGFEIQELLKSTNLLVDSDELAKVYFIINSKNEIVVLNIETKLEALDDFIKNKLNYYKVKTKKIRQGKRFAVNVRLTNGFVRK